MNHAKLEASRHTVFLIPVCTGGLRAPDRGSGAVFSAKSGGFIFSELGRPAAPGRIRRWTISGPAAHSLQLTSEGNTVTGDARAHPPTHT